MHGVMCSLASGPIHGELIRSMLDPDVGLATVPVGERTDAIAGAEYVVQPILQQLKRNAEVHLLRDLVCRLDVQGQLGDDSKSTKRHRRARKIGSIVVPLQLDQAPVCN